MAYERLAQRRRYTHSAVRRAWLYCLLIALPALLFAAILIFRAHISTAPALLIVGSLLLYLLLLSGALIESLIRPLQTLSNVVASLPHLCDEFSRAKLQYENMFNNAI